MLVIPTVAGSLTTTPVLGGDCIVEGQGLGLASIGTTMTEQLEGNSGTVDTDPESPSFLLRDAMHPRY